MVVADEQALIMKEALEGFDTPHLQKLIVVAYDRWNWDSGTDADKLWFTIAEEILAERGVSVVTNLGTSTNITFNMGANGPTVPVLTMDQVGDLVLGTKQTLKLKNSDAVGVVMEAELFDIDTMGNLNIGWALKQAIINFMAQEMTAGSVSTNNGQTFGQHFEEKVLQTLRNRI
jgi:hypothetical protein